jgi:hypothetical protein
MMRNSISAYVLGILIGFIPPAILQPTTQGWLIFGGITLVGLLMVINWSKSS